MLRGNLIAMGLVISDSINYSFCTAGSISQTHTSHKLHESFGDDRNKKKIILQQKILQQQQYNLFLQRKGYFLNNLSEARKTLNTGKKLVMSAVEVRGEAIIFCNYNKPFLFSKVW